MWITIAKQANISARSKISTAGKAMDAIDTITYYSQGQLACHNMWRYVNSSDTKMFMVHLIIMGLVQKSRIDHYWSTCNFTKIPFSGKYMLQNHFQNILWNLNLSKNMRHPPPACPACDPLHKMTDIIGVAQDNFKYVYKPSNEVSLDESSCQFKGQILFECYNPGKPKRYIHICPAIQFCLINISTF